MIRKLRHTSEKLRRPLAPQTDSYTGGNTPKTPMTLNLAEPLRSLMNSAPLSISLSYVCSGESEVNNQQIHTKGDPRSSYECMLRGVAAVRGEKTCGNLAMAKDGTQQGRRKTEGRLMSHVLGAERASERRRLAGSG